MAADRESKKSNQTLREFRGINTKNARTVIGDDQFAWLENVMPLGFGNLTAVPGPGVSLATWPTAIYFMQAVNLNAVDYMIGFGTNGAGYAINLTTYAVTTFAAAATFQGSGTTCAQWENSQLVIVDPTKGYFTWDGTTLTNWVGTIQNLTIKAIGVGYSSQPTLTFSSGSATATSDIQIGLATLTAAGTGYATGDILTMVGGSFFTAGTVRVASVNATTGAITGISLNSTGDYTIAPANPVSVTGGYGTAATFTLNFGIGPVTLGNKGSGYTGTPPTIAVTGGGGTGGLVTPNVTAVPSGGTAVATYSDRVWVASGRTVVFSGASTFNDFTAASAGGSFIMVDEKLHSNITGFLPANNYLYVFGSSSINLVSDVSVVSGATVFSNTNISASIGSSAPYSFAAYYRGVWFSAPYGIYALYGSTASKASDDLDTVFGLLDTTVPISTGSATISKVIVQCFLLKYLDPVAGSRSLIAVFFDKKWFFSSQTKDLTLISSSIVGGTPNLYGTNGTNFLKMFSDFSTPINQKIVTKLWDMGKPISDKQSFKVALEINVPVLVQTITGTIDTENTASSYPFNFTGGNLINWVNNLGNVVQWMNASGTIVSWISAGYAFESTDVGTVGKYLGLTINGSTPGITYSGMHIQYEERAAW